MAKYIPEGWELVEETETPQVPKLQKDESNLQARLRHAARTGARIGETILGMPGDIANVASQVANWATRGAIPTYDETRSKSVIGKWAPPTSSDVREFGKNLTGGYLEPQGKTEKFADEVIGDLTAIAAPVKGKIPLKSAFKVLGANTVGWLGEEITGSKGVGEGLKVGTMLASSIPNAVKALKEGAIGLYDKASSGLSLIRNTLKETPMTNAEPLAKVMRSMENMANRADTSLPLKKFLRPILKDLQKNVFEKKPVAKTSSILDMYGKPIVTPHPKASKFNPNNADVEQLWEFKKDLNNRLLDWKNLPQDSKKYIEKLSHEAGQALHTFGFKHPEFGRPFSEAESIWKGIHSSSKVNDWLKRNVNISEITKEALTTSLFGGIGLNYVAGPVGVAAGAIVPFAAKKISEIGHLFKNSPQARQLYKDTMKAAMAKDAPRVIRNISQMDKVVANYNKKQKQEGANTKYIPDGWELA